MHETHRLMCESLNVILNFFLYFSRCAARARVGGDNHIIDAALNHNHAIIQSRRPHKEAKRLLQMKRNKRNRNDSI